MDAPGTKQTAKKADPDGKSLSKKKTTKVVVKKVAKKKTGATTAAAAETTKAESSEGTTTTTKAANRSASPKPTRRSASPKPTRRSASPKPTRRAASPKPTRRAASPKPTRRTATSSSTTTTTAAAATTAATTTTPPKTSRSKSPLPTRTTTTTTKKIRSKSPLPIPEKTIVTTVVDEATGKRKKVVKRIITKVVKTSKAGGKKTKASTPKTKTTKTTTKTVPTKSPTATTAKETTPTKMATTTTTTTPTKIAQQTTTPAKITPILEEEIDLNDIVKSSPPKAGSSAYSSGSSFDDDSSMYDELTYYDEETLQASIQSFDEITLPDNERDDVWVEEPEPPKGMTMMTNSQNNDPPPLVKRSSMDATEHAGNTTPNRPKPPVVSPFPKEISSITPLPISPPPPQQQQATSPQSTQPSPPAQIPVVVEEPPKPLAPERPFRKASELLDPFYDPVIKSNNETVGAMNPTVPWDTPKNLREYGQKHGHKLHTIKVFKETQQSRVGITVAVIGGYLFVLKINQNGLLADTRLQVGDIIVSINEFSFRKFPNAKHAYEAVRNAVGYVYVVARKSELSGEDGFFGK